MHASQEKNESQEPTEKPNPAAAIFGFLATSGLIVGSIVVATWAMQALMWLFGR